MTPGVPDPSKLTSLSLSAAQQSELEEALGQRDYKRAERLLVALINEHPNSYELLTFAGGLFFRDKDYLNCAVSMSKAEKVRPLDPPNRFTLAMAYIVLNRHDWARPQLERLVKEAPKSAPYLYWLARVDYEDRLYDKAIEKLLGVIELDGEFMKAYDNLGLSYEMIGRLDEALAAYRKAVALNRKVLPPSPWPPLNMGTLIGRMGDLETAEACLREALQYDPKFSKTHYQLGLLLEQRGKYQEAVDEFSKAAQGDPSSSSPHLALGRVYRELGDREKSDRAYADFRRLKKKEQQSQ